MLVNHLLVWVGLLTAILKDILTELTTIPIRADVL